MCEQTLTLLLLPEWPISAPCVVVWTFLKLIAIPTLMITCDHTHTHTHIYRRWNYPVIQPYLTGHMTASLILSAGSTVGNMGPVFNNSKSHMSPFITICSFICNPRTTSCLFNFAVLIVHSVQLIVSITNTNCVLQCGV